MKSLIVTADDVGLHRGMTEGAIRAHREGIVTACSIVANGAAFDHAAERLRDVPSLEIGVHLTLVEERSLTTSRPMPKNYVHFLISRRGNVETELRAQIEKVLASGLRVTHLNGHQHLHVLPSVARIVRRLADEFDIGYVRRVNDRGGRGGIARRLSIAALNRVGAAAFGRSAGETARRHTTNDHTIGVVEAGHLTASRMVQLLDFVDSVTELVCHPGIGVDGYAHWRYEWEEETRVLCDPRLREKIAAKGIELIAPSHCSR